MKFIANTSVATKMISGLSLAVVIALAIAASGFWGIKMQQGAIDEVITANGALRNHLDGDMMHDALRADVLAALIAAEKKDAKAMSEARSELETHAQRFRSVLVKNDSLRLNDETRAALATVRPVLEEYIKAAEEIVAAVAQDRQRGMKELSIFMATFSVLEEKMERLSDLLEQSAQSARSSAVEQSSAALTLIAGITLLGTLTSIGVFTVVMKSFVRPIRSLSTIAEHVASGDFTVEAGYTSDDEIGRLSQSVNNMIRNLHATLLKVQDTSAAVASATSQVSSSVEEMAAGAHEQESQIREVASSIGEMTNTILHNSQNASDAAKRSLVTKSSAEHGGTVVVETIKGMKRISEIVQQSANTIEHLSATSEDIGRIASVIDDIADQTNLLALNAAIEAARAGEAGRGFAVVADEVRRLSERTTNATKDIAATIKKVRLDTAEAVHSIEQGTTEVAEGIRQAQNAGDALSEIVANAEDATEMITRIAAASEEQSASAGQIANTVDAIARVTHESTQGTQQIAKATEGLNQLMDGLQTALQQFKLRQVERAAEMDFGTRPRQETDAYSRRLDVQLWRRPHPSEAIAA